MEPGISQGVLLHDHQIKSFGYAADDVVRNGLVLNLSGTHPRSVDAGNPSTWMDMTGRNKVTTFNSPTFQNNCIHFDATFGQYADIGTPLRQEDSLYFSLEAWIKVSSAGTHDEIIFGTAGSAAGYFKIGTNPANFSLLMFINTTGISGGIGSTGVLPRTTDDLYHVCAVRDNTVMKMYANGKDVSAPGATATGFCNVFFNSICKYATQTGTCNVFAARVYNRPLNSDEVRYNYNKNLSRIFL